MTQVRGQGAGELRHWIVIRLRLGTSQINFVDTMLSTDLLLMRLKLRACTILNCFSITSL